MNNEVNEFNNVMFSESFSGVLCADLFFMKNPKRNYRVLTEIPPNLLSDNYILQLSKEFLNKELKERKITSDIFSTKQQREALEVTINHLLSNYLQELKQKHPEKFI